MRHPTAARVSRAGLPDHQHQDDEEPDVEDPAVSRGGLAPQDLVARRDQGDVLLLTDSDGNGRFDDLKTVVAQFKGVHGIVLHDGFLYLCSNRELKRYKVGSDNIPQDTTTIFKDLPDGGQHGNRTLAFGPDGKLYISVGSDCNDCNEIISC